MSAPWWGREASPNRRVQLTSTVGPGNRQPLLHREDWRTVFDELRLRVPAFTKEWTNLRQEDAGYALLRLFSEQTVPVLQRLNRLPDKAFVEFLRTAGVKSLPGRPARTMLAFNASPSAPQSVLVTAGFQVSAPAADDSGDEVIFETERTLFVAPAEIQAAFVQEGHLFHEVDVTGESGGSSQPFGSRPRAGAAILLGLSGKVTPKPTLSFGIQLAPQAAAVPPPVSKGSLDPQPQRAGALLRWEFFDGGGFEAAEIVLDETLALTQSGIVELRVPSRWRPGIPAGLEINEPLRWLRLRLVHGNFDIAPSLSFIRLNSVAAVAVRTIRDEVVEFVPGSDRRRLRLSQTPVIPESLVLVVDEGEIAVPDPETGIVPDTRRRWKEVDALSGYGPNDKVYVLDGASGELTVGDGVRGAALPPGFRHVIAQQYKVGGGTAGAVDAEAITSLVHSRPFLTGVVNPRRATGGTAGESLGETLRRGPQEIRAGGRAVTTADYALLALRAPGAELRRAYAVSGQHPNFTGAVIPGLVTVYIVAPDQPEGPPLPLEATLAAVAQYLTERVAPIGVEIVAAAPRFHHVSVRATLAVSAGVDTGEVVQKTLNTLDNYLHPLKGGEDGTGWSFGGPILHNALVRRLLQSVSGLRAVSSLNLIVDGLTLPACADFQTAAHALLWPETHEVVPVVEGMS
jgi:predicted phage baseplate assembly protein